MKGISFCFRRPKYPALTSPEFTTTNRDQWASAWKGNRSIFLLKILIPFLTVQCSKSSLWCTFKSMVEKNELNTKEFIPLEPSLCKTIPQLQCDILEIMHKISLHCTYQAENRFTTSSFTRCLGSKDDNDSFPTMRQLKCLMY